MCYSINFLAFTISTPIRIIILLSISSLPYSNYSSSIYYYYFTFTSKILGNGKPDLAVRVKSQFLPPPTPPLYETLSISFNNIVTL